MLNQSLLLCAAAAAQKALDAPAKEPFDGEPALFAPYHSKVNGYGFYEGYVEFNGPSLLDSGAGNSFRLNPYDNERNVADLQMPALPVMSVSQGFSVEYIFQGLDLGCGTGGPTGTAGFARIFQEFYDAGYIEAIALSVECNANEGNLYFYPYFYGDVLGEYVEYFDDTDTVAVDTSVPVHLIWSWDAGAKKFRVFINGVEVWQTTLTITTTFDTNLVIDDHYFIVQRDSAELGGGNIFIDEVKFYNFPVRANSQATQFYNRTLPAATAPSDSGYTQLPDIILANELQATLPSVLGVYAGMTLADAIAPIDDSKCVQFNQSTTTSYFEQQSATSPQNARKFDLGAHDLATTPTVPDESYVAFEWFTENFYNPDTTSDYFTWVRLYEDFELNDDRIELTIDDYHSDGTVVFRWEHSSNPGFGGQSASFTIPNSGVQHHVIACNGSEAIYFLNGVLKATLSLGSTYTFNGWRARWQRQVPTAGDTARVDQLRVYRKNTAITEADVTRMHVRHTNPAGIPWLADGTYTNSLAALSDWDETDTNVSLEPDGVDPLSSDPGTLLNESVTAGNSSVGAYVGHVYYGDPIALEDGSRNTSPSTGYNNFMVELFIQDLHDPNNYLDCGIHAYWGTGINDRQEFTFRQTISQGNITLRLKDNRDFSFVESACPEIEAAGLKHVIYAMSSGKGKIYINGVLTDTLTKPAPPIPYTHFGFYCARDSLTLKAAHLDSLQMYPLDDELTDEQAADIYALRVP